MDIIVDIVCSWEDRLVFPLDPFLLGIIGLAADEVSVVREDQHPAVVHIDKTEGLVELEGDPDGVGGEEFAVPLDFLDVVGDDDLSDLPLQPAAGVDGLETEHLVEHYIVGAVRLAHEVVHGVAVHEGLLELDPVIALSCGHGLPPVRTGAPRRCHRVQ